EPEAAVRGLPRRRGRDDHALRARPRGTRVRRGGPGDAVYGVPGPVRRLLRLPRGRLLQLLRPLATPHRAPARPGGGVMELEVSVESEPQKSVEATFEEIFQRAMRKQPQMQHIVVSSEQGLVIAYKARIKGAEAQLAALSPVLGDAGEALFNALSLTPRGEIMLVASGGTACVGPPWPARAQRRGAAPGRAEA